MKESEFYDADFWFHKPESHGDDHCYTSSYWGYQFYERLVVKLSDIPENGHIVVLGTRNCESFDILCEYFGRDRCIGYDLANPTNHPCVQVKNVLELDQAANVPISFVHNDIGSFVLTPMAKLHAQRWAADNVITGGYFLGRNNLNTAKYPLEELMTRLGFTNCDLLGLTGLCNLADMSMSDLQGHMLSKKIGRKDLW